MEGRDLFSFLCGFVVTSLAYGFLLFLYVLSTFSLGGQTLLQKESEDTMRWVIMLLVVSVTLYTIIRFRITKRIYASAGIVFPFCFAVFALIASSITVYRNLNYIEPFDQSKWSMEQAKPFNMAKTMARKGELLGMKEKEIVAKLGECMTGFVTDSTGRMNYDTDKGSWQLQIDFNNRQVTAARIYEPGWDD